jgi:hypothetical protein
MSRWCCCILLLAIIPPSHADAGLRCVPGAVNLGEVRGGAPRVHRFELLNDGPTTLAILDIEPGCGCLSPRLEQKTLKRGEKTTLVVELRTTGQPNGPRSWNLRIRYRDGHAVREELLVVSATIRNEVTVQPSILALYVQDMLRQEVVVTDLRTPPLKVTSLYASSPAIRATVQSAVGGVTKLQLDIVAAKLNAGKQDAMLCVYTNDPLYSPLQLPISLTRVNKSTVSVTPAQVEARVSPAQPVAAALVRLHAAAGRKVIIASAEGDDPGVTCTWASGPGSAATLKVRVDARRLMQRDRPHHVHVRLAEPTGEIDIPVATTRN